MPESEVIKISIMIVKALAGLHNHDAVHRDIKPQNIMIKNDGTPILVDFGGAKMLHQGIAIPSAKTSTHTPGWACPHQELNSQLTPQCDLYSFGRTIFYMITGVMLSKQNFKNQAEYFAKDVSKYSMNILPFLNKKAKNLLRQTASPQ